MPTRWRVAVSLHDLRAGEGVVTERSPIDYLASQGYMVVYKEEEDSGNTIRFLLWRLYDGEEIAVEKRYVPPGDLGPD